MRQTKIELVQAIRGMQGFVNWGISRGLPAKEVLQTLSHDLYGLVAQELEFLPRSHGYAQFADNPATPLVKGGA